MSNILNHNRDIFQFDLNKKDYWDFHICIDRSAGSVITDNLTETCLSAFIDLSDNECIWFDSVYSKQKYVWSGAINDNTLVFNNFGYTSVDNGKTSYKKDAITNRDFFALFTGTTFTPQKDDVRLVLSKVGGNHQLYDYSNDIARWHNEIQCAKLNGGWYQGFFAANNGCSYKTLPTELGDGWDLEFVLNKEDFENDKETLNDKYPENKGTFFYIGTRAENKWWTRYTTDHDFIWCKKNTITEDYVVDGYIGNGNLNDDYFQLIVNAYEGGEYFTSDYIENESNEPDICDSYVLDDYYEKDLEIDENMELKTSDGYDMYQPNIEIFETDNKFIIFDRTCDGMTVKKWEDGDRAVFNYIKHPNIGNYFTLFHRACGGYDVKKIQEVLETESREYNVLADIYRNALAFQIKDDGTLGYKYLVRDCESEVENYKIESQFTKIPVITDLKWHTIHVRLLPYYSGLGKSDKMIIYMYVDGKLVLVSNPLSIINLRTLDDLNEKQEGVPYNISIGGGTQGLAEVVYLNYLKLPEYVLPLEKEFGGSFVGWLKSFKFYACPLNYTEVVKNYNFAKRF